MFVRRKIYKGILIDIAMEVVVGLRYPRLDTVLNVENFIREHDGEFRKKQLWEALPKGMMYQTFSVVIDYLISSGKISVDSEGKIGWIFYPHDSEERLEKAHLFWRKK
jgi:hypothetical protein